MDQGDIHRLRSATRYLTAKLENGVLTVAIKKRAESQPQKIEIL